MTDKNTTELYPKYRPDIDGLRAIAILSVLGYHAFPDIIKGGFIGVDIFFVISGYLISSIIFSNLEHHSFNLIGFYNRRIRRIFPALITVMLTMLLIGKFILPYDNYAQLGKHITSGAAFISNFTLYKETGYFDSKASTKPLLHLWSLAIEEQFYIFWPLLLAFVWRRKWNFLFITTSIAIVSLIISLHFFHRKPPAAFYYPIARFWELMIGGILAYAALHRSKLINKFSHFQASLGLILLIAGLLVINKDFNFSNLVLLLPTIGAFFLISSGPNAWFNKFFLSNRILVGVGLISYPLYLWHWPLLSFLYITERGNVSVFLRLMAILLSFVLAALTYHFIEKPIRHSQQSTAKILTLVSMMIVLGITGQYIYTKKGLNKYVYTDQDLNDKSLPAGVIIDYFDKNDWAKSWEDSGCSKKYLKISSNCKSMSMGPPSILLIGDSHSEELYPGLVEAVSDHQSNMMQLSSHLPFYNTAIKLDLKTPEIESDETNRELDFALSSDSVKTIILSFWGNRILTGTEYASLKPRPVEGMSFRITGDGSSGNPHTLFETAMNNTLMKLSQSHKRIIFVVDTPEMGFNPKECFDLIPFHFQKTKLQDPCAIPRRAYDDRSREYRDLVFPLLKKYPAIQVFDPASYLCDDKYCWAMKDGKVLYQDDNHVNLAGSRYLAKHLSGFIKF